MPRSTTCTRRSGRFQTSIPAGLSVRQRLLRHGNRHHLSVLHGSSRRKIIADRISVGWPVRGVTVELIAPHGSPATDAVGEITVAGDAVASGYWDSANRRLNPRPAGAFATGDLGYRLADGRIFLTGRRDFVVKLHGYRIDLREVERAMSRVAGIGEAAAVVSNDCQAAILSSSSTM